MKTNNLITSDRTTIKQAAKTIQVGLSACLAGEEVRYNGGHTQSRLCLDVLSEHFSFKTFCPEVAAGFGTPRPTMRLIGDPESPELVFSQDESKNLSAQLIDGFQSKLEQFASLDGYILMKNSPSCGLERVKVYQTNGHPHETRVAGLFTQALQKRYPLMPIEEEGRLHDHAIFDNFVQRVYAYSEFRTEVLQQPSISKLVRFHSNYKYLIMAHNQNTCKQLGRLIANHQNQPVDQIANEYFETFMLTLKKPASRGNHTNTLMHLLGYLKSTVPSAARQNIVDIILKYKSGVTPLTTPRTLLSHYLKQHGSSYINAQRYLNPYPESLNPLLKYY